MDNRLWITLGIVLGVVLTLGASVLRVALRRRGWLDDWETELGLGAVWPLAPVTRLLTVEQAALYRQLEAAFPGLRVLPHIDLSRTSSLLPLRGWRRPLVVDFLLCEPQFIPLAVIELDTRCPAQADRRWQRHRYARRIARVSRFGLPHYRIPVRALPGMHPEQLQKLVPLILPGCDRAA